MLQLVKVEAVLQRNTGNRNLITALFLLPFTNCTQEFRRGRVACAPVHGCTSILNTTNRPSAKRFLIIDVKLSAVCCLLSAILPRDVSRSAYWQGLAVYRANKPFDPHALLTALKVLPTSAYHAHLFDFRDASASRSILHKSCKNTNPRYSTRAARQW